MNISSNAIKHVHVLPQAQHEIIMGSENITKNIMDVSDEAFTRFRGSVAECL